MPRYFVDVSDIVQYISSEKTISGIQRVSFEITKNMIRRKGAENVKLCYHDGLQDAYLCIDSGFLDNSGEFDFEMMREVFGLNRPPPSAGFKGMVQKVFARVPEELPATLVRDAAEPGDYMCIMGATWGMPHLDTEFQALRRMGMSVSLLIYDLIPIVTPQFVVKNVAVDFLAWLDNSVTYVDRYFVISEHTGRDLTEFLRQKGVERPVRAVPLAQDSLSPHAKEFAPPTMAEKVKAISGLKPEVLNLTRMPYVLCVGTIESRKNSWRLAQAWRRLSARTDIEAPRLVFAGKKGWLNDDFFNLMEATGNLGGWVQFALLPTDAELDYLYRNCLFTITASHYEGWGLPIGEGLSYGKTAVVSDNSSMPEVGGDLVEYCDAMSIGSIEDACLRLIADPGRREALEARIRDARLRSWSDVADDFLAGLAS